MINEISSVLHARQSAAAEKPVTGSDGFAGTMKASSEVDLDAIFEEASKRYGIPLNLLKSVAKAESNFRADATSRCGAMGIMQLMPGTAKSLGVTDAYNPEQNIMGGAKYLRQMLDKFGGDVSLALAAYNAGPGAVSKYGGIPPYEETQNYVQKVIGYMGGGISAGTVTYGGSATGRAAGRAEAAAQSEESAAYMESLADMMLMRIFEMQMRPSEDDENSAYRKVL